MMKKKLNNKGISLIETIISITVFVILATVSAQSIALSLRGARKSESTAAVRDNLSFAVQNIEQKVRNAKSIVTACPFVDENAFTVQYDDGSNETFTCLNEGPNGQITLGNGQPLTSSTAISITNCSFSCSVDVATNLPPEISMTFSAVKKNAAPIESSPVTIDSSVRLRVY